MENKQPKEKVIDLDFIVSIAIILLTMLAIRGQCVYEFRYSIVKQDAYDTYFEMPSYERMVFSLKPLTHENWLTKEQIKTLNEK